MDRQQIWDTTREKIFESAKNQTPPIEKGIEDVVIALNVLGVITLFSCEGHMDKGRAYPWVMIKDKKSIEQLRLLLRKFYKDPNYNRDADVYLIIVKKPYRYNPVSVLKGNGGETLDKLPRELLTPAKRIKIMRRYRSEMDLFCTFLKKEFFGL